MFARFRPEHEKQAEKPVAEDAVKTDSQKDKTPVMDLVQDNRERLVGKKRPKEPRYPPKGMEKKSEKHDGPYPNINPPPPAVDIMKDGKRKLACI